MNKIVIIGCGNVGMSYAYALVNSKTNVDELVLIDVNKAKAEGEAMDLCHTLPYAPNKLKIYAGDYGDCFDLQEADIKPLLEPAEQLIAKVTSLIQQEIQ